MLLLSLSPHIFCQPRFCSGKLFFVVLASVTYLYGVVWPYSRKDKLNSPPQKAVRCFSSHFSSLSVVLLSVLVFPDASHRHLGIKTALEEGKKILVFTKDFLFQSDETCRVKPHKKEIETFPYSFLFDAIFCG